MTDREHLDASKQRYEVSILIGPCSEGEADAVAEAVLDLPEVAGLGAVSSLTVFSAEMEEP